MRFIIVIFLIVSSIIVKAQTFEEYYAAFKGSVINEYDTFRNNCNIRYSDFLKWSWAEFKQERTIPIPKEKNFTSPQPFFNQSLDTVITHPVPISPIDYNIRPIPVSPIYENEQPTKKITVNFYGLDIIIRIPSIIPIESNCASKHAIAQTWRDLSKDNLLNNTIRDCLKNKDTYKFCDWAYLQFVKQLSSQVCSDKNAEVLLMAYIFCQSGYQTRIGIDNNTVVMLFGCQHLIYNHPYFQINGMNFYPIEKTDSSIQVCDAAFEGETPLSLIITQMQEFDKRLCNPRTIISEKYPDFKINSSVSESLIQFYNGYPISEYDDNPLTKWAIYANTPINNQTKKTIYPSIKSRISNCTKVDAANKILNLIQTGFVYEYDDKVWGYDRAFFSEETLYYPYCDCEDRSILFSRLIRDLLDLDVALIYYPGHLATAVCFNEDVKGDAMIIDGRKFIVCDPTYIGAPVGVQMPDLEYDKAQAIVLNKDI